MSPDFLRVILHSKAIASVSTTRLFRYLMRVVHFKLPCHPFASRPRFEQHTVIKVLGTANTDSVNQVECSVPPPIGHKSYIPKWLVDAFKRINLPRCTSFTVILDKFIARKVPIRIIMIPHASSDLLFDPWQNGHKIMNRFIVVSSF